MSHEHDERGFPAIPEGTSEAGRAVLEQNRQLLSVGRGDDYYRRTVPESGVMDDSENGASFHTARDQAGSVPLPPAVREASFVTARGSLAATSAPSNGQAAMAGFTGGGVKRGLFGKIADSFRSAWSRLRGGGTPHVSKPKRYPWMKPSAWNAAPYRAGVGRDGGPSGGRVWKPDPTLDMPQSHVDAWEGNTSKAFDLMQLRRRGAKAQYQTGRKELEEDLRSQLPDAPGSKRGDANRVSGLMRTMLNEATPSRAQNLAAPSGPSLNAGMPLDGIPLSDYPSTDYPEFIPPAVRSVFPHFNPDLSDGGVGMSDYMQADIHAMHPSIDHGKYNRRPVSSDSEATLSNWAEDQQYMDDEP